MFKAYELIGGTSSGTGGISGHNAHIYSDPNTTSQASNLRNSGSQSTVAKRLLGSVADGAMRLVDGVLARGNNFSKEAAFLDSVDSIDRSKMYRRTTSNPEESIRSTPTRSLQESDPIIQIGTMKLRVSKLRMEGMEDLSGYIAMNEQYLTDPYLTQVKIRAISRRIHDFTYKFRPEELHAIPIGVLKKGVGMLQYELVVIDNPKIASENRNYTAFVDNGFGDEILEEVQYLIALKIIQEQSRITSRKKLVGKALDLREKCEKVVLSHLDTKLTNGSLDPELYN